MLREEIRFLLMYEPSSQLSEYPKMLVKLSLFREYFLNSKQTVLQVAESIYEVETQSRLDFRDLKLKTKKNPKTDGIFGVYSSVVSEKQQIGLSLLDLTKRDVLLLCRSTTDDSKVIRSKVRALVRAIQSALHSAIIDMDALIRRLFKLGQEVDRMYGQALCERLNTCMLRMNAIMEDRVLIGARTITQLAFVGDPGAQAKVQFVKNSGRFAPPFKQQCM